MSWVKIYNIKYVQEILIFVIAPTLRKDLMCRLLPCNRPLLLHVCARSVTQLCPTVCNPTDCSLPDSSVHGVFQARILDGVTISYSRGSSQPRDQTQVSCVSYIDRWILYHCTTWEAPSFFIHTFIKALSMSRTGKPGMLQSMGSQRVRHDWATELNWTISDYNSSMFVFLY